ncbi:MAG: hypothetical protein ACM3PP_05125 [Candidatus Saccharibacteria bacterium]
MAGFWTGLMETITRPGSKTGDAFNCRIGTGFVDIGRIKGQRIIGWEVR